jgi:copper chaperone CopZ
MEKRKVKIPSINCIHCVHTIESELKALPGVVSVHADLASKEVEVEWDKQQNWSNIVALLRGMNYPPQE